MSIFMRDAALLPVAPPPKLDKPVGFFMTHAWWWTPEYKYEHVVPQADFDWIAAHGNGDYVAEQLVRPAVVDYRIAFACLGGTADPWFIPDNARSNLTAALKKLTPAQARMIMAYVLVDEPDVRNVDAKLLAQAITMMREVSVAVFGFSPPVLISYSYAAFDSGNWPCFDTADLLAFDFHPVTYFGGGLDNPGAGSKKSWRQMLAALHAKRLPGQKLVVVVETATTKPELTWLLNVNLQQAVETIRPIADDVAFIVGFNWQGVTEGDNVWVGANKLPDLQWREIL